MAFADPNSGWANWFKSAPIFSNIYQAGYAFQGYLNQITPPPAPMLPEAREILGLPPITTVQVRAPEPTAIISTIRNAGVPESIKKNLPGEGTLAVPTLPSPFKSVSTPPTTPVDMTGSTKYAQTSTAAAATSQEIPASASPLEIIRRGQVLSLEKALGITTAGAEGEIPIALPWKDVESTDTILAKLADPTLTSRERSYWLNQYEKGQANLIAIASQYHHVLIKANVQYAGPTPQYPTPSDIPVATTVNLAVSGNPFEAAAESALANLRQIQQMRWSEAVQRETGVPAAIQRKEIVAGGLTPAQTAEQLAGVAALAAKRIAALPSTPIQRPDFTISPGELSTDFRPSLTGGGSTLFKSNRTQEVAIRNDITGVIERYAVNDVASASAQKILANRMNADPSQIRKALA